MKYPLSYNTWNREEIRAINQVLKSGFYTMGKVVKKFENKFARYFNSKHAIMVNSGSSANLLMFTVLKNFKNISGCGHDDGNVVVPMVGWSTSFYPVSQNGFDLNFVDVNTNTLNIDTNKIEDAINSKTRAILAINMLGNPCNFDRLKKISKKYNIVLLEDNCESFGSRSNHAFSGTHGLMGSFSFFFSHHLQTMEGGMILTNDKNINYYLRSLRAHGWDREFPNKSKIYKKSKNSFKNHLTFVTPGYSLRPLEIEAACGLVQLKKWPKLNKLRLQNAETFKRLFENKNWCTIQKMEKNHQSSWYSFNILLTGQLEGKRDKIIKKLSNNGIDTRPTMTGNFSRNPVMKYLKSIKNSKYNEANFIDKNGFFIGNYPKNLTKELHFVYKLIEEELN